MKTKKNKITNSNKIFKKAIKIIPTGSQSFSKGHTQFVDGVAPKYLDKGIGSKVWDVDGNKYIDYIMGCHPLILGYADKDINNSVIKQLKKGSTFSQMNELEVDVSEILIDTIPSAEMVRFGKNGADATGIGVRIARSITKRDHIAFCGYHGWHDWYISNTDLNSGIPDFNRLLAHSFKYNDIDSLERIFKKYKNKIAIVIMEPLTVLEPKCYGPVNCKSSKCKKFCKKNFLSEVKRITHENGALLMFDEIITGFRFDIGGAQNLTGVTPDLSSFAKAMSNGIPISAIVGKKKYMKCLDKTFFSFTYGGDCIGLAATKTCIPKLKRLNVAKHLDNVGKRLKKGYNKLAEEFRVNEFTSCIGYNCRTIVSFNPPNGTDVLIMKSWFQQELLKRGVLWTAYHALSYMHKEKEIDHTLDAFYDIFKSLRKIVDSKKDLKNLLEGEPVKPVFRKVADFNSYIQKDKL